MKETQFDNKKIAPGIYLPAENLVNLVLPKLSPALAMQFSIFIAAFANSLTNALTLLREEITWASESAALLKSLAAEVLTLIALLEEAGPIDYQTAPNANERFRDYNAYFNIMEVPGMNLLQLMKQDAQLLYWLLPELAELRMDDGELTHYLKAAHTRWAYYLTALPQVPKDTTKMALPPRLDLSMVDPMTKDDRIATAFFRWMTCHYDFAINIIHANQHLLQAASFAAGEQHQQAAAEIKAAAVLLRGSTTSMVIGSIMPPKIYQEVIRPSMGNGFTGNDNPQWAGFKIHKATCLANVKCMHHPVIYAALLKFLEAYLQDIEVHTGIAAKLIGEKTSLTVDEMNGYCPYHQKNERPAVSDLRNLHYIRLKEFAFLNHYPMVQEFFNKA